MLTDRSLLALAAKKAFKFVDRREWYHDRTQSLSFMARLNFHVAQLSREIEGGTYTPSLKTVFLAPKRIETRDSKDCYTYRPLCRQSFRDEVVEVALLCLFANHFEPFWGDTEKDCFPDVWSFGNRLHLVKSDESRAFSVGNARIYRDWGDDYARFVKDTEAAFNNVLTGLNVKDRAALICTDLKSFYPSIDRSRFCKLLKQHAKKDIRPTIERLFGAYDVQLSAGSDGNEARLASIGLPQGPAHSGFWANVYLSDFDRWVMSELTTLLVKRGILCKLRFYARYVDDMRFVFRCKGEHSDQLLQETENEVSKLLQSFGLELSKGKTSNIVQDSTGSLLTTGQVAERMQSITKRAYFPLPPENLKELAKEVRLLFHAEMSVNVRSSSDSDAPKLLDNPGVRTDSRRRFAANKWAGVARDLDRMSVPWGDEKKVFAQELVRVWHEDPGQTQLLQRALELGLQPQDIRKVLVRLNKLKENPASFGYYAFVLSYLFDALVSTRLSLKEWPMLQLAKEVFRQKWEHPILINKAQHYLLRTARPMVRCENEIADEYRDTTWLLRNRLEGRMVEGDLLSEVEEVGILCALPTSSRLLLKCLHALLQPKDTRRRIKFLRALLVSRKDLALQMVHGASEEFFELAAFRDVVDLQQQDSKDRMLFRRIREGAFKAPLSWTALASHLGRFVLIPKNKNAIARGLLNPFALCEVNHGNLFLKFSDRPMPAYQGYAVQRKNWFLKSNTRGWALPVGLILKAAATARPTDLLGMTTAGRFSLAGTFASLVRAGGKLPQQAGSILDRLLAWHGSKIEGYKSVHSFLNDIAILEKHLKSNSVASGVICDIDMPKGLGEVTKNSIFNLVICQIPSHPASVDDAMIRRALSIARMILEQKGSERNTVDLVVFPELSVPSSSVRTLYRFVRQTRTLVLAGLELRIAPDQSRRLNELMWIVPLDDDFQNLAALLQEKIHVSLGEKALHPPVIGANPAIIWRINGHKGRLAAINCYEFTDLLIRELLRGRVEGLVIAANNQDVTTFDNLVESTHYDLFSHVILVNAEKYGGSAVRAPYKERWDSRIFDIHGSNLFAVNVCSLNLRDFRGQSSRAKKSWPAGFEVHP